MDGEGTADDLAVVERQLGRAPRAFRRVAVRCPFGLPAVTEQRPFDDDGEPFPTQFWLTCPHLVAQISRLEAGGGRRALDARRPRTTPSCARASRRPRRAARAAAGASRRDRGSSRTGSLKCLHAHAAFALARPGYELGDAHPRRGRAAVAAGRLLLLSMIRDLMDVELARQQWEDGRRRVERAQSGSPESRRLAAEIELSWPSFAGGSGQTFTLEQLAALYDDAGEWARDVLFEARPEDAPPPDTATVTDAAFQMYARGARRLPAVTVGRAAVVVRRRGGRSSPRASGSARRSTTTTTDGGMQTLVRTLDPLPLAPAARTTVTVTTTAEP